MEKQGHQVGGQGMKEALSHAEGNTSKRNAASVLQEEKNPGPKSTPKHPFTASKRERTSSRTTYSKKTR